MPPHDIDDVRLKRTLTHKLVELMGSGEISPPQDLLQRVPPTWPGIDVASPAQGEITPEAIYRSASRSTVAVGKLFLCQRCGKHHATFASGFVIARSDLIVTNHHVVDDPDKQALGIMTLDGSVYPVRSVVAADRHDDLAVLQVPADDLVPLPLGDEPAVGAPVHVLSHPAGRLFTFTSGIVSRYSSHTRREDEGNHGFRLMAITAAFGSGSSGAPVLDARGAVVGVVRQTKSIYFKPEDEARRRLQMVLKHCAPAGALRELGFRSAEGL